MHFKSIIHVLLYISIYREICLLSRLFLLHLSTGSSAFSLLQSVSLETEKITSKELTSAPAVLLSLFPGENEFSGLFNVSVEVEVREAAALKRPPEYRENRGCHPRPV